MMDHSYCRPWNWRPETSYMRPTKCLFVWKTNSSTGTSSSAPIDVTSVLVQPPTPIYDTDKARSLMEENERHAAQLRLEDRPDDWESQISRVGWTQAQQRLFSGMLRVLDEDRLGRLTYEGSWNEPVLRHCIIDKSASRARALFANISWDARLGQWLHGLLVSIIYARIIRSKWI